MVTDAGFFPRASGHLVERPSGSPTHLIIVCLRGRGWIRSDGRKFGLARGDVVGLPAGHPHTYGSEDDEPWSIAWVHFCGEESDAWLEFGFGRRTVATSCHVPPERLDLVALDRVHLALGAGYGLRELIEAAGHLGMALAALARLRVQSPASMPSQERVAAAVARIRTNFLVPIRVSELAAAAGLSVTHFTAIFREQTGYPPLDYLIRMRIRRAAHLLMTSHATVGEIAAASGFSDAYYFTRRFTKVMGCSPRAFRKAASPGRPPLPELEAER